MDWKNGRKLTDPQEFKDVKDMFFAIDYDYTSPDRATNEELMELQSKRNRSKRNQAR